MSRIPPQKAPLFGGPGWTAILLAGQRPGVDPLAEAFGETWKAQVRIAGEAMLSRVAKTLLGTPGIDRIVVLAQEPEALFTGDCAWLADEPKVTTARSTSGIAASVAALAGSAATPFPVLLTTADHPLLTPAMVEAAMAGLGDADVGVGMVAASTLLAAYPDNKRTWLRFRGEAWTGANLFALGTPKAKLALEAWSAVERDRKKALKLLWHFGPLLAIRAATRTITLAGALAQASKRLGFRAVPIALPFAEAGIDIDKPSDHALAEAILMTREAS
ncbi:GTP:adenosylcobinamide-phosphate guanylyltransferase [Sphingomonas vulcanisoli]|uniref:GTP:adenosylcobinamide-phosphate guanylyltransferase n=1 Tax=Sphingomonas vulcanisoli TaxID=1658060 RepID=A0ABX0TX31_9SPHN|nr:NTP transferase domain-containing protein [Sphingomonas vulcanisoli]NIJ08955.1 GTP:adenosylcobinamide-phosphate guanylyltransferase [Sphingomonas vulcanisoli]